MYKPSYFKEENFAQIKKNIRTNGFATLISHVNNRLWATHIPLLLDKDGNNRDVLIGHVSKANKQWNSFEENEEVLAIFTGNHSYISSAWYDHESAPTWNYEAIHIYGKIRIIEEAKLRISLKNLVDKYESGIDKPIKAIKEKYLKL